MSPLRYGRQDGHLKIFSSIVLASGQDCTLSLDRELLDCERTGRVGMVHKL